MRGGVAIRNPQRIWCMSVGAAICVAKTELIYLPTAVDTISTGKAGRSSVRRCQITSSRPSWLRSRRQSRALSQRPQFFCRRAEPRRTTVQADLREHKAARINRVIRSGEEDHYLPSKFRLAKSNWQGTCPMLFSLFLRATSCPLCCRHSSQDQAEPYIDTF